MASIHRVMSTTLAAACVLVGTSATIHGDDLGADVNRQLARARAATVQFHDPANALAAGYIDMGVNPGEGDAVEYVNFDLVDCTLDVTQPEALRYAKSDDGLRLIGVEYVIPMACSATPPEDEFLPGAGEWEPEPGVPVWNLAVFFWSGHSADRH